jgi:hypothetical protein
MLESNLNRKALNRHLPKVICGLGVKFILKFIPQITNAIGPKLDGKYRFGTWWGECRVTFFYLRGSEKIQR